MEDQEELTVAYDHDESIGENAVRLVDHSAELLEKAGPRFQVVLQQSEIMDAARQELARQLELIKRDNPGIVIGQTRLRLDNLLKRWGIGIASVSFTFDATNDTRLSAIDECDFVPSTLSIIPGDIEGARRMLLGYKIPSLAGGEELSVVSHELTACILSKDDAIPKFLPDSSGPMRGPLKRTNPQTTVTFGADITLGISAPVRSRLALIKPDQAMNFGLLEPDFQDTKPMVGEVVFARYLTHRALVDTLRPK